jgi:hypothetical protein
VDSHFARELHDAPLSEEIKLLGDLVLAASGVARHLTQDEVDQILRTGHTFAASRRRRRKRTAR